MVDNIFYAFAALLFAAVIFFLEGLYTWWSNSRSASAKRMEKRLRTVSAGWHGGSEQQTILKQRYLNEAEGLERLLLLMPRMHTLDRLLEQSGTGWSPARFMSYTCMAFLIGLTGSLVFRLPAFVCLLIGAGLAFLPLLVVHQARSRRFKKFELQLPEVADLISRALRAGHAFPSTLQMVRDEMPEPASGEFRIAADEINFGVPMNEALMNLVTRMPLTDLRYFVIAVLIQRESGGNLAEILENISQIIRERLKLLGRIRVLSAEGKMSAWVLGILPFAVALVISLVNPDYLTVLWTDPLGLAMVGGALTMMLSGVLWMRSIIRIRV